MVNVNNTRDKILDSCEEMIQVYGFSHITYDLVINNLKDIKRDKSIITKHFPGGKNTMVCATIKRYRERFIFALNNSFSDGLSLDSLINYYIKLHYQVLIDNQKICLCAALGSEFKSLSLDIQKELEGFIFDNQDWIYRIFQKYLNHDNSKEDYLSRAEIISYSMPGVMISSRAANTIDRFPSIAKDLFIRIINGDLTPL